MSILSAGKDKMLALFLRQRLNDVLQDAGTVESLSIDTQERVIHLALRLEGEADPVTCDVRGYNILSAGEARYLQIGETTVSKGWLDVLVRRFLVGKRFRLPGEYGDLVKRLLG
jgi:hypothetical protein